VVITSKHIFVVS